MVSHCSCHGIITFIFTRRGDKFENLRETGIRIVHFRFPYVAQKRRVLYVSVTLLGI